MLRRRCRRRNRNRVSSKGADELQFYAPISRTFHAIEPHDDRRVL